LLLALQSPKNVALFVKNLLTDFWDKFRFAENDRNDRNMESIAKNLAILERVEALKTSGALDNEGASRLKHQLTESCISLVSNGVMIREIAEAQSTTIENRKLLEDNRKLLIDAPKSEDM
jgi:hypothetical protein